MVNRSKYIILASLLFSATAVFSQNYHAVHGSSYAGSLGVANNPASIGNTPYKWDVTLFGGQLKYSTNIVSIFKYSLLSKATTSEYLINSGIFDRYGTVNLNMRILNARFAINPKHAVAAGANLRSYTNLVPSEYFFFDTARTVNSFLRINHPSTLYNLDVIHSSWLEAFASYSRTIWETDAGRLNFGITAKAMRGISGAFGEMKDAGAARQGAEPSYLLSSGSAQYGYSSNYDRWRSNNNTANNLRSLFDYSQGGFSFDLGAEYLIKSGSVATFNDPYDAFSYEWKVGLALLDLGKNNFKYGRYSRDHSNVKAQVSDAQLQQKFRAIKSVPALADSLATVVSNTSGLSGNFSIAAPARIVLNFDRYLFGHFYLNGELSLNLPAMKRRYNIQANEFNLIAVSPRWETARWGFYLPVLYNTRKRVWVGGAVKAGPLLFGIHNWGNVFSTKKMQRGGGYMALLIRPREFFDGPKDKRFECPDSF